MFGSRERQIEIETEVITGDVLTVVCGAECFAMESADDFFPDITNYNQSNGGSLGVENNWEVVSSLIFILIKGNWWPTSCDDTAKLLIVN